jgi:hypothetical protein
MFVFKDSRRLGGIHAQSLSAEANWGRTTLTASGIAFRSYFSLLPCFYYPSSFC